jgi:hypothetical protein
VKFWDNEITRLPGNFRTRDKILILPSDSTGPFRAMGRFEAESPARGHRHKTENDRRQNLGVTLLGETRAVARFPPLSKQNYILIACYIFLQKDGRVR